MLKSFIRFKIFKPICLETKSPGIFLYRKSLHTGMVTLQLKNRIFLAMYHPTSGVWHCPDHAVLVLCRLQFLLTGDKAICLFVQLVFAALEQTVKPLLKKRKASSTKIFHVLLDVTGLRFRHCQRYWRVTLQLKRLQWSFLSWKLLRT